MEPSVTVPIATRAGWRMLKLTLSKWLPWVSKPGSLTLKCLLFTLTLWAADSGLQGMEMCGLGGTWWAGEPTLCGCHGATRILLTLQEEPEVYESS